MEQETQTMEVYTSTQTGSPFYTLPPNCNEVIAVQSLLYSGEYKDIDFINITKGETVIGFSLYYLFDASVKNALKVIYK
jgi:hypothetical protein